MKSEYRAKMCVDALKYLTTEQIEELKVWLKAESTTLMFDYVAKNRLLEDENTQYKTAIAEQAVNHSKIIEKLEAENERMKNVLKEIGNTFKPLELSMWDFVDILRDKAKQALNGK
jgi:hypothetical protein